MDKKELVQKIVESAVARGGVFLEDSMLGNAIEGILDDYPVIGDANRDEWDWWGSAHADMAQFDNPDNCADIHMSASVNAYGDAWAGEGKIGVVAYAWTGSNSTDTEQVIGRALFNYDELRQLTLNAFTSGKVNRIRRLSYGFYGVLCDRRIHTKMLRGVVEHAPTTAGDFSWADEGLCYSLKAGEYITEVKDVNVSKVATITVTADGSDVVVGRTSFSSVQLWNVLLGN